MTPSGLILPTQLDAMMLDDDFKKALAFAFPDVDPGLVPYGGRVLVQIRRIPSTSKGGIHLIEETKEAEKWNTQIAKVVALGPLAFRNRTTGEPWPEGVWCSVGEFVRVPKYGGDRWEVEVTTDNGGDTLFTLFEDHHLIGKVTGNPLAIKAYL